MCILLLIYMNVYKHVMRLIININIDYNYKYIHSINITNILYTNET